MPAKGQSMPEEHRRKIGEAHKLRAFPATKRCPSCQTVKAGSEFKPRNRRPGDFVLHSYCKACGPKRDRGTSGKPCKIDGCPELARAKGMCWKHRARFDAYGDALAMPKRFSDPVDALNAGTDRNGPIPEHRPDLGPCWIWTKSTNGKYGTIKVDRFKYAHRFSYEIHKGPIPAGLVIDHLCRTWLCVNPDHLEAVTNRENLNRGVRWPKRAEREACVLAYLAEHPDSTARQVGELLGESRGAAGALLRRLQSHGLLASRRLATIGRPSVYRLAEAAVTAVDRAAAEITQTDREGGNHDHQ